MWPRSMWIKVSRMHAIMMDFGILGTFDEAPGTVQGPRVRADARRAFNIARQF